MNLLKRFFGFGPKKTPAQAEPVPETTYSETLIDMPNVMYRGISDTGESLAIRWNILINALLKETEGTTSILRNGYLRVKKDSQTGDDWVAENTSDWEEKGFQIVVNKRKDIDSFINFDMLHGVMEVIHKKEPARVMVILVSGDGGYARSIKKIRELCKARNLPFRVMVYSWRDSLSSELKYCVGERNVRYLDDMEHLTMKKK